jgi:hypothetical protein
LRQNGNYPIGDHDAGAPNAAIWPSVLSLRNIPTGTRPPALIERLRFR